MHYNSSARYSPCRRILFHLCYLLVEALNISTRTANGYPPALEVVGIEIRATIAIRHCVLSIRLPPPPRVFVATAGYSSVSVRPSGK